MAYAEMARFYDAFAGHHDHRAWLECLLPAAERAGLSGRTVLDVGCGTGKSFLPLAEQGWEVTACDASPEMLEVARSKAGPEVRLEVADLRDLPVFGAFDLVLSLGDVSNYLTEEGELERAVAGMASNLAPDGVLLFDANTLKTYRTFYSEAMEREVDGLRLAWRGLGDGTAEPGSLHASRFEVERLDTGGSPIGESLHRQRHLPEARVRRALEAAGLECRAVYGHGFDSVLQELDEDLHTKAIYIAGINHEGVERR